MQANYCGFFLMLSASVSSDVLSLFDKEEAGRLLIFLFYAFLTLTHPLYSMHGYYFDKNIPLLNMEALLHIAPCLKFGDCISYFLCNVVWLYTFLSAILRKLSSCYHQSCPQKTFQPQLKSNSIWFYAMDLFKYRTIQLVFYFYIFGNYLYCHRTLLHCNHYQHLEPLTQQVTNCPFIKHPL